MQRVLLLSADEGLTGAVAATMRRDAREFRAAADVADVILAAREWRPGVLIVDLGIDLTPRGVAAVIGDPVFADGVGVLAVGTPERLRWLGPGVPLDDFIVPPPDDEELAMRVARVLALRAGADDESVVREGPLAIDLERYKVTLGGEAVDLTYKEYELLRFLATNPGKPFTREALLNRVWGYDYYGGSRTVDVHVRRIRAKIERDHQFLETVRNVGYRFVDRGTLA